MPLVPVILFCAIPFRFRFTAIRPHNYTRQSKKETESGTKSCDEEREMFLLLILPIFHGGYTVLVYLFCDSVVIAMSFFSSSSLVRASEPFVLSIK